MKTAFALALTGASALRVRDSHNPVTQVVNLLKGMIESANAEKAQDEAVYNKWVCFCNKEHKSTKQNIDDANAALNGFDAKVIKAKSDRERLTGEIKELTDKVKHDEDELNQKQEIRDTEYKAYNAKHQEAVQFMEQMKGAITVLGGQFADRRASLKKVDRITKFLETRDKDSADKLKNLMQLPSSTGSQILGMLTAMLEKWGNDDAAATEQENNLASAHQDYRQEMESTIQTMTDMRNKAVKDHSDATSLLENSQESFARETAKLNDNMQKMRKLKIDCQKQDDEYKQRTEVRAEEEAALKEAMGVLTASAATAHFQGAFAGERNKKAHAFLQTQTSHKNSANRVAQMLKKFHNAKLSPIYSLLQTNDEGYFKFAIEKIGKIAGEIKEDMAREVQRRDQCTQNLHESDMAVQQSTRDEKNANADLQATEANIEVEQGDLKKSTATNAQAKESMKAAQLLRIEQSVAAQAALKELNGSQVLLQKSLDVLKEFYRKNGAPAANTFVQTAQAPEGFSKPVKQSATNVLDLIQTIMADAAKEMEMYVTQTNDSASAFEDDFFSSMRLRENSAEAMNAHNANLAQLDKTHAEDNNSLTAATESLGAAQGNLKAMHESCDFIIKYFDTRQESMQDEIDQYEQAVQILRGASGSGFNGF